MSRVPGAVEPVDPPGWGRGRGYSNGSVAPAGGAILFVAGQVGWDRTQQLANGGFGPQFEQSLRNVVEVVRAAGGAAEHIGRLTIFVVDKAEYLESLEAIGQAYRKVMAGHYPAMTLVEVKSLLETGARVEIEGTAVLPAALSRVVP